MSNNLLIEKIKKYYLDKLTLVEFNDVIFPLNLDWKKIAFSISGGADSAILAYIICSHIQNLSELTTEVHFISNIRMWETRPWQRYISINVFDFFKENFPNINFVRHENFIAPEIETGNIGKIIPHPYIPGEFRGGDQLSTISFTKYICTREKINAWFSGVTKNPPKKFYGSVEERDDPKEDIQEVILEHNNIYVCHPFRYKDKSWIISQYKNFELHNLLDLTRSCEGDKNSAPEVFKDLDFYSYTPNMKVPECGKCFWCKERNWAKQQNGL